MMTVRKAGTAAAIAVCLALAGCGGAIPDKFPTDGEGQGTLTIYGDKYAGEFHGGKLNGPGTATFASGAK